jgi:arsenate reductase (thioredoxin)
MLRDLESMPLDEQLAVRSARDRLVREFDDRLDTETIDAVLDASWQHIDALARLKTHVPLLAERFARAQLWAVARMRGHRDGVPAVLFVDTDDAGRARMAKALFLRRAGIHGLALSAGTDPNAALDGAVRAVMEEVGIKTTDSFPKPYTMEILQAADMVVTFVGGREVPLPDEAKHLVWDVRNPRERTPQELRAVRDQLADLVDELADRLGIPRQT